MKGIQGTSNKTYRQIMGNGLRYEIPKFQRDYTWESDQWDDLWQDLMAIVNDEEFEHYMGYLVLQTSDNKNFSIIDGQQRLTTMSLLILAVLKCLEDLAKAQIDADNNLKRKEALQNSYIGSINPVTLISDNKIKLNRNSDAYYRQHLVLLGNLPIRNINNSEKHMRECFEFFYLKKLKSQFITGEALAGFLDNIVDKLSFTVIEVNDQLNAFKVFETLNARGVQLSSADLVKNYLFSVVDATNPHHSEIDEVENLWSAVLEKLGEKKFEEYLRYYWNSKNKTVRKSALFKTIRSNISRKQQVFELLRALNATADVYLAIQDPHDPFWMRYPDLVENLSLLKLFRIKQVCSLLLSAYQNLDIESFSKLVHHCVIISFRYNVIGGLNANLQEDIYNKMALSILNDKQYDKNLLKSIYIEDNNFTPAFIAKEFKPNNHLLAKYILSEIESTAYQHDITKNSDIYTIEHILPQSADARWGDFKDEEIDRCVYRLGNLTLLEHGLNKNADTLSFEEKKEIFAKSHSLLTKEIADKATWNEKNIIDRQKALAKQAKSIWKIQF